MPSLELSTGGGDACPVCRETVRVAAELGDYELFACAACGCWSSNALARSAVTSFEPSDYFEHADADRDKWTELLRRLGARSAAVRSVLDVGCGTGAFLDFAGAHMPAASRAGIELDSGRAEEARQRNPGARVLAGDALEVVRTLDGPFDLITLWDVFEHVQDPRDLLIELGRLLSPTGVVYVQTIHERSVLPGVGRLAYRLSGGRLSYPMRRTHDAHHLVFFTRRGLRTLAEAARLDIADLWFDRLARRRMDGHPLVTAVASLALAAENALGNGLFVNVLLQGRSGSAPGRP